MAQANQEVKRVDFEWSGTLQANGAEIILAKPSNVKDWIIVLAKWNKEYVVWNMCESTQEFQSGEYFRRKKDALNFYKEKK